ncbi:MAG: hypothetical protein ACRDFY_10970 [Candidatus Limnocylindria bacterium]
MPAKRVLISIDERLLVRVDRAATRRGMSRSGYLAELATRDIGGGGGPGMDPGVAAALRALDDLFAGAPAIDGAAAPRDRRGRR